jgi:hypothetical protein
MAYMLIGALVMGDDEDDGEMPRLTGSAPGNPFSGKAQFERDTAPSLSFRVGGTYLNYGRLDPWAQSIGTAVNIWDAVRRVGEGQDKTAVWADLASRSMGQVNEKTMLRGVSDMVRLAQQTASENFKTAWADYANSLAVSFVPASIRSVSMDSDEFYRETSAALESKGNRFLQRTARYATDPAPVKLDWLGREKGKGGGPASTLLFRATVPLSGSDAADHQLNRIIMAWNEKNIGKDAEFYPTYFRKSTVIDGKTVRFTDEEYSAMMRERGEKIIKKYNTMRKLWRINIDNPSLKDMERIEKIIDDAHSDVMKKYKAKVAMRATRVNSYK